MTKYIALFALVGLAVATLCPDQQTECPDHETCCELSSGGYGCCKYQDANCCSDHLHCCPSGYRCNLTSSTCVRQAANGIAKVIPAAKITEAQKSEREPDTVHHSHEKEEEEEDFLRFSLLYEKKAHWEEHHEKKRDENDNGVHKPEVL